MPLEAFSLIPAFDAAGDDMDSMLSYISWNKWPTAFLWSMLEVSWLMLMLSKIWLGEDFTGPNLVFPKLTWLTHLLGFASLLVLVTVMIQINSLTHSATRSRYRASRGSYNVFHIKEKITVRGKTCGTPGASEHHYIYWYKISILYIGIHAQNLKHYGCKSSCRS